jgi:hypothetical protein
MASPYSLFTPKDEVAGRIAGSRHYRGTENRGALAELGVPCGEHSPEEAKNLASHLLVLAHPNGLGEVACLFRKK